MLRQRGLLGLRRLSEGGVAGIDGREHGLRTFAEGIGDLTDRLIEMRGQAGELLGECARQLLLAGGGGRDGLGTSAGAGGGRCGTGALQLSGLLGRGTAILAGGPGAVLWMWLTGVFGMATGDPLDKLTARQPWASVNGNVLTVKLDEVPSLKSTLDSSLMGYKLFDYIGIRQLSTEQGAIRIRLGLMK